MKDDFIIAFHGRYIYLSDRHHVSQSVYRLGFIHMKTISHVLPLESNFQIPLISQVM